MCSSDLGSQAGLIPNPSLLQQERRPPAPLPWTRKTETLYFRGGTTGSTDFESNIRVALCQSAKTIPDADCRLSKITQVDQSFARRLVEDDIVGPSKPVVEMNRHKYLIEADGNASSWDRYKYIGLFGGVPIRFECGWEECWHEFLVEGFNCVLADRKSLPDVVERLRSRPREAHDIAMAAQHLVKKHLSPKALRERLALTLSGA